MTKIQFSLWASLLWPGSSERQMSRVSFKRSGRSFTWWRVMCRSCMCVIMGAPTQILHHTQSIAFSHQNSPMCQCTKILFFLILNRIFCHILLIYYQNSSDFPWQTSLSACHTVKMRMIGWHEVHSLSTFTVLCLFFTSTSLALDKIIHPNL